MYLYLIPPEPSFWNLPRGTFRPWDLREPRGTRVPERIVPEHSGCSFCSALMVGVEPVTSGKNTVNQGIATQRGL